MLLKDWPKDKMRDLIGKIINTNSDSTMVLDVFTRKEMEIKYPYRNRNNYDFYIIISKDGNYILWEYPWTIKIEIEGFEI